MKYFKYYRLTTLTNLRRGNIRFSLVFSLAFIYITNIFFSEKGSYELGISMFFIVSVFIMSTYAYQRKFQSKSPIYQFPLTEEERTRYEYLTIFVAFVGLLVIMVLLLFILIGLVDVFSSVEVTEGETIENSFWEDAYSITHHLLIVAFMMPLSYIKSSKKRYIFGGLSVLGISLFNFLVYLVATGSTSISSTVPSILTDIPHYQFVIIGLLSLSAILVVLSYRTSVKINRYK